MLNKKLPFDISLLFIQLLPILRSLLIIKYLLQIHWHKSNFKAYQMVGFGIRLAKDGISNFFDTRSSMY